MRIKNTRTCIQGSFIPYRMISPSWELSLNLVCKVSLSCKMMLPDGWSQDLDILWEALPSLWQAAMWFCPAGIMNRRGAREGSYGGPLSSMWQGEKWEQEEVKDGKMIPHDCSIWYPWTGFDGKGIGWWWLEKKMVEPKVTEGWGWHRTEVGIITGVKEPGHLGGIGKSARFMTKIVLGRLTVSQELKLGGRK